MGFSGGIVVKYLPANADDMGLFPGSGRLPGVGNGNRLQYSCLENPMDRGVWRATVHGVTKSQTRLSTHECIFIIKISHRVSVKIILTQTINQ